jgi:YD repeat-containing protein
MAITRTIRVLLTVCLLACSRSADAQQVCYAYDGLGRLTGVIDEHNQAALYDYDAGGNIVSIRRPSPTGPVTIFSFDPPHGAPGTRVEIFGIGFSPTAHQNQVLIGGALATIVSTLPCALVIHVPGDATSGPISVTTPRGHATSSAVFLVSGLVIGGEAGAALPNGTVQFSASANGCSDPSLVWRVNGIIGGNSVVGTITAGGLYTAPEAIPNPATVTIRADSVSCTGLFAETQLTVVSQLNGFVLAAVSANFGTPPMVFPPHVVMHAVSTVYGMEPPGPAPGAVLHSVSVANVPVITGMSPTSAARGSNVSITITGVNLTGATDLRFFGASTPDAAMTATNVVVDPTGTSLTAHLAILSTAATGTRTVLVASPGGNSTSANTSANAFTVTP